MGPLQSERSENPIVSSVWRHLAAGRPRVCYTARARGSSEPGHPSFDAGDRRPPFLRFRLRGPPVSGRLAASARHFLGRRYPLSHDHRRRVHGRSGLRKPERRLPLGSPVPPRQFVDVRLRGARGWGVRLFQRIALLRRPLRALRVPRREQRRDAGDPVPQFALADVPDGNGPAAAGARVDIRCRRRGPCHRHAIWSQHVRSGDGRASDHVVVHSPDGNGRQPPSQRVAERDRGRRRHAAGDPFRAAFARKRASGAPGSCRRYPRCGRHLVVSHLGRPLRALRLSGPLARAHLVPDLRRHDEVLVVHVRHAARGVPGRPRRRRRRRQPACEEQPAAGQDISVSSNGHWDLCRSLGHCAARAAQGPRLSRVAVPVPRRVRGDERPPGAHPVQRRVPATLSRHPHRIDRPAHVPDGHRVSPASKSRAD